MFDNGVPRGVASVLEGHIVEEARDELLHPGMGQLGAEELEEPVELADVAAQSGRERGGILALGGLERANLELQPVAIAVDPAENANRVALAEAPVEELDVAPDPRFDSTARVYQLQRQVVRAGSGAPPLLSGDRVHALDHAVLLELGDRAHGPSLGTKTDGTAVDSRVMALRALVCVLVSLGAASCGGGGDQTPESDGRRAERINLRLSDFPSGWRKSADKRQDAEAAFLQCLDIEQGDANDRARSGNFAEAHSAEASSAWSEAAVFTREEHAQQAFNSYVTGLRSSKGEQCSLAYVRHLLEERYRGRVQAEAASVVPLSGLTPVEEEVYGEATFSPPPDLDEGGAWRIAVSFHVCCGGGQPPTLSEDPPTAYVDVVQLRRGNILSRVQTLKVLAPSDLRDDLVAVVASRMSK